MKIATNFFQNYIKNRNRDARGGQTESQADKHLSRDATAWNHFCSEFGRGSYPEMFSYYRITF